MGEVICSKLTKNVRGKQWDQWVQSKIPYDELCPNLKVAPDVEGIRMRVSGPPIQVVNYSIFLRKPALPSDLHNRKSTKRVHYEHEGCPRVLVSSHHLDCCTRHLSCGRCRAR